LVHGLPVRPRMPPHGGAMEEGTKNPRIERADHELPVGCESVVGSFTRSPLTHVARDCLT